MIATKLILWTVVQANTIFVEKMKGTVMVTMNALEILFVAIKIANLSIIHQKTLLFGQTYMTVAMIQPYVMATKTIHGIAVQLHSKAVKRIKEIVILMRIALTVSYVEMTIASTFFQQTAFL